MSLLAEGAFRCLYLSDEDLELLYRRIYQFSYPAGLCTESRRLEKGRPVVYRGNDRFSATHIVLIAEGRLPTNKFDHASHLCGNRKCVKSEHLVWEMPHLNVSRDLCLVHDFHCDGECPHEPPCVRHE